MFAISAWNEENINLAASDIAVPERNLFASRLFNAETYTTWQKPVFLISHLVLYQNTQYHSVQQSLQTPNIPQQSFAGPHAGMNLCRICDVASSLQLHGPHLSTLLSRHCRILYTSDVYENVWGPLNSPHLGAVKPAFITTPVSIHREGTHCNQN